MALMMQHFTVVLVCLACVGHGRRMQMAQRVAHTQVTDRAIDSELFAGVHQSSRRPSTDNPDSTTKGLSKLLLASNPAAAFKPSAAGGPSHGQKPKLQRKPQKQPRQSDQPTVFFDPLNLHGSQSSLEPAGLLGASLALLGGAAAATAALPLSLETVRKDFDPATFQPVCPASDGFYRLAQNVVITTIGPEDYKVYAPLVAEGLLRVRLELCVLESYFIEAIVPFVRKNGLSWVLPIHESVETFLAGVIFAVATSFILIGSTKILTVIATLGDLVAGLPFRFVGGIGWRSLEDKALEMKAAELKQAGIEERERPWWRGPKPREAPPIEDVIDANSGTQAEKTELAVWGGLYGIGVVSQTLRQLVERLDSFAGRELYLLTVFYVAIKFIHFKIWDPFP